MDGMVVQIDNNSNYGNQFSPLVYGMRPESDQQSEVVQSFDKTKRTYKTLVAAAKNMKLPEDNNKLEEVTNIDTQASENGGLKSMN